MLNENGSVSGVDEAEAFCDSHCTWLDHHPDCTVPVGYLGVNKQGEIGKFRTSSFSGAMPVFAHPKQAMDLQQENARLRAVLEEISSHIECDGPGCYWCSLEDGHPPTAGARLARAALTEGNTPPQGSPAAEPMEFIDYLSMIRNRRPDIADRQAESLASYLVLGWTWDGQGGDKSENISLPGPIDQGYIRVDGTFRRA